MTAHVEPAPDATRADGTAIEEALETVSVVDRACIARIDHRGIVVLVGLDAARATAWARAQGLPDPDDLAAIAAHPAVARLLDRALASQGHDPATVEVRVVARGWLPGRDAFPARIRRRCVRARYAPLLMTMVATPLLAA
jgi:hypothetical protein